MKFPPHKCGLYLTHNEHRDVYESLAEYIQNGSIGDDFESPAEMERALKMDECWVLQWYPETPVGFNRVAASTLEDVLRLASRTL